MWLLFEFDLASMIKVKMVSKSGSDNGVRLFFHIWVSDVGLLFLLTSHTIVKVGLECEKGLKN